MTLNSASPWGSHTLVFCDAAKSVPEALPSYSSRSKRLPGWRTASVIWGVPKCPPILLPPRSRDRQLVCLLPVCFSQPQCSRVLYPYGVFGGAPGGCSFSQLSGAEPEGFRLFHSPSLRGWRSLGGTALLTQNPGLPTAPRCSHMWSLRVVFFSLQRKMIIEDETEFCGEGLLRSVLKCKVRPRG